MGVIVENRSGSQDELALSHIITGDFVKNGASIDTRWFANGVTFVVLAMDAFAGSNVTFSVEEDDDFGFSSPSAVSSDRLVGSLSDLTRVAPTPQGAFLKAIGVVNTKQYVRIVATITSGATGIIAVVLRGGSAAQPITNDSPIF